MQTNPNAVSFRFAVGRHVNAAYSVCDGLGMEQLQLHTLRSNFKPFVDDQIYEILRQCREPLVLSNIIARLSMSCFSQKIFAIKSRSRGKTEQM